VRTTLWPGWYGGVELGSRVCLYHVVHVLCFPQTHYTPVLDIGQCHKPPIHRPYNTHTLGTCCSGRTLQAGWPQHWLWAITSTTVLHSLPKWKKNGRTGLPLSSLLWQWTTICKIHQPRPRLTLSPPPCRTTNSICSTRENQVLLIQYNTKTFLLHALQNQTT